METFHPRPFRARGGSPADIGSRGRRPHSRNKQWTANDGDARSNEPSHSGSDGERWERGGHRGGRGTRGSTRGVGRFPNPSIRPTFNATYETHVPVELPVEVQEFEDVVQEHSEKELETPEEREKFYQELVKAREIERKKAIAEGKMDDPLIPKRLEDAIYIVGTCQDMCPRFERYRRERENNLQEWEMIPGTKRVDHQRAVKMYERAAGDKTLPSDLRPPHVLKRTLDYLFHDLLPRGGFSPTFNFIRDRSRAVRNDFTMQHITGELAIECHDRCARFHILALHFERDRPGFSIALEEQQLMNTLQSLKEFYEDQRGRYESPSELEMRVYHRLIHIRDQKERHEDIPEHITSHPVFRLTTDFRLHVQRKSAPITKTSALVVDAEGMQIFGQLANVLREQGSVVMIYLVACILERLFGKETVEDIESIRGDMSIPDVIDGISTTQHIQLDGHDEPEQDNAVDAFLDEDYDDYDDEDYQETDEAAIELDQEPSLTVPPPQHIPQPATNSFSSSAQPLSAFANLTSTPNIFGGPSFFSTSSSRPAPSIFGGVSVFSSAGSKESNGVSIPTPTTLPPQSPAQLPHAQAARPIVEAVDADTSIDAAFPPTTSSLPNPFSKTPNPTSSFAAQTKTANHPEKTPDRKPSFSLNPVAPEFTPPKLTNANTGQRLFAQGSSTSLQSALQPSTSYFPFQPSGPINPPGSSTRKSSTPPLLKVDTTLPEPPPTPGLPPPLAKKVPISLPPTPSNLTPSNSFSHLNGHSDFSKTAILSPLYLSSPNASGFFSSRNNLTSTPTVLLEKVSKNLLNLSDRKGKAPARDQETKVWSSEELEAKASDFLQRGQLVKRAFAQWQKRATDRAAWLEACRSSDTYRQKAQQQRLSQGSPSDKKRRLSTVTTSSPLVPSPQKKRARRRISTEYQPPRTDEELARRLKENHEEHERRWAQGSFLQVIRKRVSSQIKSNAIRSRWRLWLSMNPESDPTAIWMERKFDVPDSGNWDSESHFSIPLESKSQPSSVGFPGILLFECTPLEGVNDEIEQKYRILDDCTRLRDMINSLPARRHFVPTLLAFHWAKVGQTDAHASDFTAMLDKLVADSTLSGYRIFSITTSTNDLDSKLDEVVRDLPFDTEGRLAQSLTIRGFMKLTDPPIRSFMADWTDNCTLNGIFDWNLYGRLLQSVLDLLNTAARFLLSSFDKDDADVLPALDIRDMTDSESTYDTMVTWLVDANTGLTAENIARDMKSHNDLNQAFPTGAVLDYLLDLTESYCENRIGRGTSNTHYDFLKRDIASLLEDLNSARKAQDDVLRQALSLRMRRSPKRRGGSEETDLTSSHTAKRSRISISEEPSIGSVSPPAANTTMGMNNGGRTSPSPSLSASSSALTETPLVTVAMLRALTRNIKQKYATNS